MFFFRCGTKKDKYGLIADYVQRVNGCQKLIAPTLKSNYVKNPT